MDLIEKYGNVPYARQNRPHPSAGIAILGAGNIVANIHINAYRKAGYEIVGITDLNQARASEVATKHNLPKCYPTLDALLEDPKVKVVDVAIPGAGRAQVIKKIAKAGKAMLVQKPAADTLQEAKEIASIADKYKAVIAINQNARWAPDYRFSIEAVNLGLIGKLYHAQHLLFSNFDGMPHHGKWLLDLPRFQIMQYGIHHLDLMRAWFGRLPQKVTATLSRKPNQQFTGDMLGTVCLDFGDNAHGVCLEFNALHPERPHERQWELTGTDGVMLSKGYDQLEIRDSAFPKQVFRPEFATHWFPDAFSSVMGDLLDSLAENRAPAVTIKDNLGSIAMAEAAYLSAEKGRTVALTEISY